MEFAETPRACAVAGADLIAVRTNWPLQEHPPEERAAKVICAQAAAPSNGVFIACCARAGVERCQAWIQGSVIVDQFGWVCRRDVEVVGPVLANRGWANRGRGTGAPRCHSSRRRVPAPGPRKVHLAAQRPAR